MHPMMPQSKHNTFGEPIFKNPDKWRNPTPKDIKNHSRDENQDGNCDGNGRHASQRIANFLRFSYGSSHKSQHELQL